MTNCEGSEYEIPKEARVFEINQVSGQTHFLSFPNMGFLYIDGIDWCLDDEHCALACRLYLISCLKVSGGYLCPSKYFRILLQE